MTTNRMGLEQTLSDEQLEELITELELCGIYGRQVSALAELQEFRKASSEAVADVVAWNKPGEERKCDIRWRRFDVAPGPLFAAPLQAVTVPDGWIKCIDRMPDVGDIVLTSKDGCVNVGEMERSGANYRYFTSVVSGRELPCTHWMPLPAAPKSVTNEP